MPTVVPFPRKFRSLSPRPLATQSSLVGLMIDLNATYDTVAQVVKDDPQRRDQLRDMTQTFLCDLARIGGLHR